MNQSSTGCASNSFSVCSVKFQCNNILDSQKQHSDQQIHTQYLSFTVSLFEKYVEIKLSNTCLLVMLEHNIFVSIEQ